MLPNRSKVAIAGRVRTVCTKQNPSQCCEDVLLFRVTRAAYGLNVAPPRHRRAAASGYRTPMLHGWENFFIVGGTAGATLIGLLFVAVTLGAGLSTPQGLNATRTFLTPTLIPPVRALLSGSVQHVVSRVRQ